MHFRFSKKWGTLDYKVWLSLIVVAALSMGLFGYKVATKVECPEINLSVVGKLAHPDDNVFFINENLTFNTGLDAGNDAVTWDMGDKSVRQAGGRVAHLYTSPGRYLVTVTINGVCKESMAIRITENISNAQTSIAPDVNPIVSNDILKIGDQNIFVSSVNTDSYEWSVDELPDLGIGTNATAQFIFTKAGNYTVRLKLGGDRTFTKIVQVIDPIGDLEKVAPLPAITPGGPPPLIDQDPLPPVRKPEPEQPVEEQQPEKAAPAKTYELLPLPAIQAMLENVVEGKKEATDFNNQLCNGLGTKVMANNKPTTFAGLCLDLKKKKKKLVVFKKDKSITSLKVVRDEANGNCITLMYVNYK
ncbi:PKD domain-containing protein [Niabella insulamsoli]|uniref:PKD domain-containing protein n=1 Tax=Niabella insulamsoli TaxID=3144874 RepID=UPI0031FCA80C